ncbi:MAG: metallophosphoesterase [Burkholderiaceae bacterium]|jgi:predicted MPP superfamily phosphohydrolase|nr:metallophosphoesterase [Burkholderiaceae bacterium]
MINAYSLILFGYIALRLIFPLPTSLVAKFCAAIPVLLIALKHYFFQHFFGGLSSPDLPRFVIILAGWLYAILVFVFILLLMRDIAACALWLAARAGFSAGFSLVSVPVSLGIILLAVICATYGVYEAIRHPDIKKMEITLARLPKALDGMTIVQISDLHVNAFNPEHKVRSLVETVNALKPDLVLLTGDIVDGTVAKRQKDIEPLRTLRARYGVFGSAGNHEYYSGFDAWRKKFAELGIHMLYNGHVTLSVNDQPLVLAGITDPVAASFGKDVPNVSEALAGAPEHALRILMAHRPQEANIHANAGIDLQLSGHTHGGQIIGLNRIVARFNDNLLMGWYDIGYMKLYISTGISLWNGFPVRFGVPSEMPVIVLRARQSV